MSKRGRIVIRNLSYKATDESVQNFFKPYGDIKEVSILKYEDGRMKGVAFLEYNNVLSALKAIKECNMKLFMNRPVAVDLAIPKEKYKAQYSDKTNSKPLPHMNLNKEEADGDCVDPVRDKPPIESPVKLEPNDSDASMEMAGTPEDDDHSGGSDTDAESTYDAGESEEEEEEEEEQEEEEAKPSFSHNSVSKDVIEGKTLFLRNLSFDATEEQVKELLSQFGELKYVLFCRDRITKRSRGTAFAQFMAKESADECLEAFDDPAYQSQFSIGGRTMVGQRAIGREDVGRVREKKTKEKEKVDKRNIYLAREGVIRDGTKSAANVSKTDLRLRVAREQAKRRMLANLNTVVSPVRLFVCNLPIDLDDKQLRDILRKHCDKRAVITECRIMRNLYQLDKSGIAISKGHGFSAFTQHKHALEALRNVNNNPSIFSVAQRPVVEFSLENKGALTAKANRLQRSRDNNPTNKKCFRFAPKEGVAPTVASGAETEAFAGAHYDPRKKGMKALQSHVGPKVRHRDAKKGTKPGGAKITRNKINHQLRKSQVVKRNKAAPAKSKHAAGRKAAKKAKHANSNSKKRAADSGTKQKSKRRKFI